MSQSEKRDGAGPGADERVDVNGMHAPIQREKSEPEDGYEPVPISGIFLALSLAMWGGYYLGTFSGNFSAAAMDGDPQGSAQVQTPAVTAAADPILVGRRVYNNCMACHQQDGAGLAGQFPPLAGSQWVVGEPTALVRILLQGLQGEVVVAGKTYNGIMPAWERLPDEQIAGVLTYIRQAWNNQASPITAEAVALERKNTAGRTEAWKATELTQSAP